MTSASEPDKRKGKAKPGPKPERLVIPQEKAGEALDRLLGEAPPKSGGAAAPPPAKEPEAEPADDEGDKPERPRE